MEVPNGERHYSGQRKSLDFSGLIKKRYGLSKTALRAWVVRGLLPHPVRLGVRNYYDRAEELLGKACEQTAIAEDSSEAVFLANRED
jgi:hypothetical protein